MRLFKIQGRIRISVLVLLCLVLSIGTFGLIDIKASRAEPVAAGQRVGLDLRRTTFVVKDIEASLSFYRDGLGLVPIYDKIIRTPRDAKDDASAQRSLRLVFLRANDDYIGVLGLMQYRVPDRPARPAKATDGVLHPGDTVLVFNTKDLRTRFEKIQAMPGVRVHESPNVTSYPSYDGKGVINVLFSSFYDPDGNYVELNEILDSGLH